MAKLEIIGYKNISENLLFDLRDKIWNRIPEGLFEEATVAPEKLDLPEGGHAKQGDRYLGLSFMTQLVNHMPERGRAIGVVDEDLYDPKSEYLFGLADPGRNALVSLTRLREEFYGREPNQDLFDQRVLKIALHEFGRSIGIDSCDNECVMQKMNALSEVDSAPDTFCDSCKTGLKDKVLLQIGEAEF